MIPSLYSYAISLSLSISTKTQKPKAWKSPERYLLSSVSAVKTRKLGIPKMRPVPEQVAEVAAATSPYVIHLSPPISPTASRCETHACRRQPHSNGDFEANVAIVLIVLLCALICALALNAAIRCFLRGGNHHQPPPPPPDSSNLPQSDQQQEHQRKAAMEKGAADDPLVAAPTLVFSAGMKLAGTEAECAICLSEFMEGEGIRVLGKCKHGFHAYCIEKWISSQASCPTCRSSCLPASPSS